MWDGLSWSEIHAKAVSAQTEMDRTLEEYIKRYGKTKTAKDTEWKINALRWGFDLLRHVERIAKSMEESSKKIPAKDKKQIKELLGHVEDLIGLVNS